MMKELSIEQKAQRYDEAIEKFDVILNLNTVKESGTIFAEDVRKIFPELKESKESKDEKIRKVFRGWILTRPEDFFDNGVSKEEILDWLKQGEQKSTNNLTQQEAMDIAVAKCFNENKSENKVKPKFKEGDWVVVSTTKGDIVVQIASVKYFKDKYGYPSYITTEGRWFGNETRARLLNDKDVETITFSESKVIKPKSSWSKSDKENTALLIDLVESKEESMEIKVELVTWLKSLKNRVQPQLKQEWTEEDEDTIKFLINHFCVSHCRSFQFTSNKLITHDELLEKIRNLRPHWKPSEKQMKALHDLNLTGGISYAGQGQTLIELYNDLKKL